MPKWMQRLHPLMWWLYKAEFSYMQILVLLLVMEFHGTGWVYRLISLPVGILLMLACYYVRDLIDPARAQKGETPDISPTINKS